MSADAGYLVGVSLAYGSDHEDHSCVLAVDVGGTKLTAAIVDGAGAVLLQDRVATPPRDVWPALARLIRRVVAASPTPPIACGVGCAGPIDRESGTISPLSVPGWLGVHLQRDIEELTGLATTVDIDAKAFALGERWRGAAVGIDNLLGVVMGSSVAAGLVIGGALVHGRRGNAGQLGHFIVEAEGRACACGGNGCLDAYCGGIGLERETGRPPQRVPAPIVERTGLLMGRAIAGLAVIADVELVVIGGSVALGFGEPFFDAVTEEVRHRARLGYLAHLRVVPAQLGVNAPLVGAAALARSTLPAT
jgi:glucokinase